MEKLKIGVLGSGDIATRISKTILNMEEVELYAVASRTYDHARVFGEKYGYRKIYKTYEEVIQDPEVDIVYIALHHTQHYEFAKKCLEYSKPVLCEKPFTINHYQAEGLIREFGEKGIFLNEALWTRFIPARNKILKVLENGLIGEPKMIDVNMICRICDNIRMTDIHMGGGALLDLGVYALNFVSMFFGNDVEDMKSMVSFWETGVDEQEVFTLKYPQGRIAVCKVSMVGSGSVEGIIYGTAGRIEVSDVMNLGHVTVYNLQNEVVEEFSAAEGTTGYEYEFLACKKALENGLTECTEMPHSETMFLMEQYDRLRAAWGFAYPCERGLE